jgi:uncharacterized HAD superfamily protein
VQSFAEAKKYYKTYADPRAVKNLYDLDNANVRQILHITYGWLLEKYRSQIEAFLYNNEEAYDRNIKANLTKHLVPLGIETRE